MATPFAKSLEELLMVNEMQAKLFMFAPGLTIAAQQSIKPRGHCGELMHEHLRMAMELSFLFVFAVFSSFISTTFVKSRVPDGGLQGLDAAVTRKTLLRAAALVGFLLNIAASALALATYTFVLQAKVGMLSCLPLPVRAGVYGTYLVVGCILSAVYLLDGHAIVLEE